MFAWVTTELLEDRRRMCGFNEDLHRKAQPSYKTNLSYLRAEADKCYLFQAEVNGSANGMIESLSRIDHD